MTVLDVYVNDRKLCRAGVGRDGVLSAIVNWVKSGAADPPERQAKPHSFELHLKDATVHAVAGVNARIGMTVYGA